MKDKAVVSYIIKVVIFSVVYFIIVGPMRSFLYDKLGIDIPEVLFNTIYFYREPIISLGYVLGLILISLYDITKLVSYISLAGKSLDNRNTDVYTSRCPDELKEFAEKLMAHNKEIEYTEQARALSEQQKNELIMYLAHDLKTPLTSVIGYLSLLDEAPDIPQAQREKYVSVALSKAYRLEELMDQFFDMTRLNFSENGLNKSKTDLTTLVYQLTEEFYPMFEEKGVRCVKEIDNGIFSVADADKMSRVFDNLIRNAVNYCYRNSDIKVSLFADGKDAVFTVKSTGDEIPDSKLSHIFDKFVRLDSARNSSTGGSGLGLYIAKEIVRMHGGEITAEKNKNDTFFTVRISV